MMGDASQLSERERPVAARAIDARLGRQRAAENAEICLATLRRPDDRLRDQAIQNLDRGPGLLRFARDEGAGCLKFESESSAPPSYFAGAGTGAAFLAPFAATAGAGRYFATTAGSTCAIAVSGNRVQISSLPNSAMPI